MKDTQSILTPTARRMRDSLRRFGLLALLACAVTIAPDDARAESGKVASGGDGYGSFTAIAGNQTIKVVWSTYQTPGVVRFYYVCAMPSGMTLNIYNCDRRREKAQVGADARSVTLDNHRHGIKNNQEYLVSVRPNIHDYMPPVRVTPNPDGQRRYLK